MIFCLLPLLNCQTDYNNQTSLISEKDISDGYVDNQSFKTGEVANVFINGIRTVNNGYLPVYSLNGKEVDFILTGIRPQKIREDAPWQNGYGYDLTCQYRISINKPGIYLIGNKIPILVESPISQDITIVYPFNTDYAYCLSGGRSFYSNPKADTVSFNRPVSLELHALGFLKWFDENYSSHVNFISDIDLENYEALQNTKLLVIVGHSEYWTRKARENFDRFVDEGNNVLILSGNCMWWQVRYSDDKTKLICYKSEVNDPVTDPLLKTINWSEPSLNYPILNSIGCDWLHGGYGLKFTVPWIGYKIVKPNSPIFEGITVKNGDVLYVPTGEHDGTLLSFRPNGIPIINTGLLSFYRAELIGYAPTYLETKVRSWGTFIVFQKKPNSGTIINTASNDWCNSTAFDGKDREKIRKITQNMIRKLLNNQNVFTE